MNEQTSQYDAARNRVNNSETLSRYADTILADWNEGDAHWQWVATADEQEIVSWAQAVQS